MRAKRVESTCNIRFFFHPTYHVSEEHGDQMSDTYNFLPLEIYFGFINAR